MKLVFTKEQEKIVLADRQDILVSAAAGSGKTAVLTERIVRRIMAGELDITQVLVVTFTEAAARNMRARIEARLRQARDECGSGQERQRLSRQLALLPAAAISTIHSFCLQVIRDFHHLALDEKGKPLAEPGFVVQDQVEADLLLRQLIDDLVDGFYQKIDEQEGLPDFQEQADAFFRLADGYGDSRSDQPLRELLRQTFYYLRSLPDYMAFARQKQAEIHQAGSGFSSSLHCQTLVTQLRLRMARASAVLPELQKMLDSQISFLKNKKRNEEVTGDIRQVLATLAGLATYLEQEEVDWDEICRQARPLAEFKLPRASKNDELAKTRFLELFCENAAEVVCFLSGNLGTDRFRRNFLYDTQHVFSKSSAVIEAEIQAMLPALDCFIDLLAELDIQYSRQKQNAAVLDFGDFEHIALAILRQAEADSYYQQRFSEVYVDEYQDTSSIQETILQAVSHKNCLMVGDIKQSIYRFRHARPEIFSSKALAYKGGRDGLLLELNKNFRSVYSILAAVNDIFAQLMSLGSAEIDYDSHQALVPEREDMAGPAVNVLFLNKSETPDQNQPAEEETEGAAGGQDDWEDLAAYEKEAQAVLQKLGQLKEQGRPWRDIVILARTRQIAAAYKEQLEEAGIPVQSDTGSQLLDSPQVQLLENMLHVLDNWRQDIPLAAVLHSRIGPVSFDIERLAAIRLFGKEAQLEYFHQAALAYCETGPDAKTRQDLVLFFSWLDSLRAREQVLPLGELIGLVFSENGWLDLVAAGPGGAGQVRLLRQFQARAEEYEKNRQKGLFRFVRYLESRRQLDLPDTFLAEELTDENAVRLMTIHGSKGLEFPVVFLAGLGYRITARDSQSPVMFSESLGLGFDFADPERRIRYPTHLKLAMLDESRAASLAEEMRLFYVAMTRAKDKLYLVATIDLDPERGNPRLALLADLASREKARSLPDHLVRSARSCLEWLVMALARNSALELDFLWGQNTRQTLPAACAAARNDAGIPGLMQFFTGWELEMVEAALVRQADPLLPEQETGPGGPGPSEERDLNWPVLLAPYRHAEAARLPLKMTVSELKERQMPAEDDFDQELPRGIDLTLHETETSASQPAAAAASLGTALHLVFRYLDLLSAKRAGNLAGVKGQLEKMGQAGMLTPAELTAVLPFAGQILAWVLSPAAASLAAAMEEEPGSVHLEMPFTLALPAQEVYHKVQGLADSDQVMIQGIIDCWYEKDGQITLIDYKSDLIRGSREQLVQILGERYQSQLGWYKKALEALTGLPVANCHIWHIRRAELVPVSLP